MPYKTGAARRAYMRNYYAVNKEKLRPKQREATRRHRERNLFEMRDRSKNLLRAMRLTRQYFARNRAAYLRTKSRSARAGLLCTITAAEIMAAWPEDNRCPVFGVEFQVGGGRSPWNASVDRIDSAVGYVASNICIISHRANTLKSNGTLADFYKLITWMEAHRAP